VASAVFLTHVLGGARFVDARYCAVPLNTFLEVELVEEPCRSKLTSLAAGCCWALKEDVLSRCLELQAVAKTAQVHAVPGPAESKSGQSLECSFDPYESDARSDPCPDVDARERLLVMAPVCIVYGPGP